MTEQRTRRSGYRSSPPSAQKPKKSAAKRQSERGSGGTVVTSAQSGPRRSVDRRKREVANARREPDPRALKLAANLGGKREAPCALRKSFARRPDKESPRPLLARLVGPEAGRAAEPRLKLVLTLLWLARDNDGWTVEGVPAATWALLFGFTDEKAGAARVSGAIRALNEAKIIEADQRRGREPRLLVRHELGDRAWTSPVGEKGKKHAEEDYYAQLAAAFWSNGWITVLSARAIAALLILLDATWNQKGTDKVDRELADGSILEQTKALRWWHLTEEQLKEQYAVSRDMFDRGVNELIDWQLVEARKRSSIERTSWGERRWYRELRVRLEVLDVPVMDVWNGKSVVRVGHSSEDPLSALVALPMTERAGRRAEAKVAGSTAASGRTPKKVARRSKVTYLVGGRPTSPDTASSATPPVEPSTKSAALKAEKTQKPGKRTSK